MSCRGGLGLLLRAFSSSRPGVRVEPGVSARRPRSKKTTQPPGRKPRKRVRGTDEKCVSGSGPRSEVVQATALADADPNEEAAVFITVDEAAALLRMNRKTIYAAIAARELPGAKRLRGVVRVHRETLIRWFTDGETKRR